MPIDTLSANPWENVGRNIAASMTSYEDGYGRMSKALAEEVKAAAAMRQADANIEETRRRAKFQTPEFGTRIAGALAGLTDPQADDLAGYLQRGNWGASPEFVTLQEGNAPRPELPNAAPAWATPETMKRIGTIRGAQMMGLAGKGDSNADHLAQAIGRLIGQGREDAALAGQITPEAAQGLNTFRAADAGKLYSFNEAGAGSQQTGKMEFNPYFIRDKDVDADLKAAKKRAEDADAAKKRSEARLIDSKVIIGPDGQPTGVRPKMTAAQEKETFEADDLTAAGQNAIKMLRSALDLNTKAYSGVGATLRAKVRSNLPGESEGANATVDLDNLMTGQALESLKATFGAAPTEGERKILMDMQASADKTPTQREAILKRAIDLAERRVTVNRNKAKALRDGTYLTAGFDPGAEPPTAPKMTAAERQQSVLKARKAIADGKDKAEVIRRLEAAGITDHGIR